MRDHLNPGPSNDFEFTGPRSGSGAMRGYAARRCPRSGPHLGARQLWGPVARSITSRGLARAALDWTPLAGRTLRIRSQFAAVTRVGSRRDTPRPFGKDLAAIFRHARNWDALRSHRPLLHRPVLFGSLGRAARPRTYPRIKGGHGQTC